MIIFFFPALQEMFRPCSHAWKHSGRTVSHTYASLWLKSQCFTWQGNTLWSVLLPFTVCQLWFAFGLVCSHYDLLVQDVSNTPLRQTETLTQTMYSRYNVKQAILNSPPWHRLTVCGCFSFLKGCKSIPSELHRRFKANSVRCKSSEVLVYLTAAPYINYSMYLMGISVLVWFTKQRKWARDEADKGLMFDSMMIVDGFTEER